jgi:hypothetical protein
LIAKNEIVRDIMDEIFETIYKELLWTKLMKLTKLTKKIQC